MRYYEILLSGLNLAPLTYHSNEIIKPYTKVSVNLKNKTTFGYVLREVKKPDFKTSEILEIFPNKLTQIQIELLNFISYYYISNLSLASNLFIPLDENLADLNQTNDNYKSSASIQTKSANFSLLNANLNQRNENLKFTIPNALKTNLSHAEVANKILEFTKEPNLNQSQKEALKFAKEHKTSLLFGDTGSGKSEIYISLIREHLNEGKQVLFLMPEISLTPQMQKRLSRYFGDKFGLWHSKITPKKRKETLDKFISGEIKLIAGARSALFLPFTDLSLIIVDEEHDESYKSAQNPRYNARDLALVLANKFDIKVLLGSATPSLTTFAKQPNFRLKGTFFKSDKSFIYDESETSLSDIILTELKVSLDSGKQAVMLLPTRANFRYLVCKDCFNTIKCPFCSVGMSFYKKKNALKCQYCGFITPVPNSCEKCESEMIEAKKLGTDELVSLLKGALPRAMVAKFDRDEITTQKKLENSLKDFNAGKIDLLVGTQMLSKGHDYHNVDLAVVMGVDELLNFPDFRARERVLALAMQVAGRAGRSGAGRVVIQSLQKEFFEKFVQDYDGFLKEEMSAREGLYPPFTRLLRAVIAHKNEKTAKEILDECVNELKNFQTKEPNLQIIGYGKCAIEILSQKYRFEILLRASSHPPLIKAGKICLKFGFDVDIDPLNFS